MQGREEPLRVCHVAATTEGATWMAEQLRALRDLHGYEVAAVIPGAQGGLPDRLRCEGIPFFVSDFDFAGPRDLLHLPFKVLSLTRLLRERRFDVVQTHLFQSMVIGRFAAWLADVPVRFSMIAGPFHLEAYTPRWIDRSTAWMDTVVIASCERTRTLYREMRVPDRRLALTYYSPDPERFDPAGAVPAGIRAQFGWPENTPLIVMVAYFYPRLSPSRWTPRDLWGQGVKGHEHLIRAMPSVLSLFPHARCLLVGGGWGEAGEEYKREMERLTAELGLANEVIFAGFRSDVNQILREADVSVQPSLNENLGGTLESLMMECPTVASRVGGMPDSVRDNETGLLVSPGDPDDLARGILALLRDPQNGRRMGKNGRRLMMERFTVRRTAQDLSDLYELEVSRLHRRGYSRAVATIRFPVAALLAAFLAARLSFIDMGLLPRWDTGWRPWNVLRSIPRPRVRGLLPRPDLSFLLPRNIAFRAYGWMRSVLAGTRVLALWDRFFAWIRGRT